MLMIVLVHANDASIGAPVRADVLSAPYASMWRILAQQICTCAVNVFVLISGWFGIKASVKGLCSLLFQVFFWGIAVVALGWAFHLEIPLAKTAQVLWFGSYYWFIIAYVGLYVLTPLLNSFIDKASKTQMLTLLICFFTVEFVYGWLVSSGSFHRGFSILSFVGLYLLARYIRLYGVRLSSLSVYIFLLSYALATLIPACLSFVGIRNGWKPLHTGYYSSPFVIAAAVSLLLAFSKKAFHSKVVNYLASGVFSVYLIHEHSVVRPYFKSFMRGLYAHLSPYEYTVVVFLLALVFVLLCPLLDSLRRSAWKWCCSRFLDRGIATFEKWYGRTVEKIA